MSESKGIVRSECMQHQKAGGKAHQIMIPSTDKRDTKKRNHQRTTNNNEKKEHTNRKGKRRGKMSTS
jgi:hypothetical protein